MTIELITSGQTDPEKLDAFLRKSFGEEKANFLQQNGDWLHRGSENRWVLLVDGVIAGYCAVIPTSTMVARQVLSAIWWVDIMIGPAFRGQGLQSHFDRKLQQDKLLKLGFPNEIAAKIHRKHHWGVREDLKIFLCPLRPTLVNQVKFSQGSRGFFLRLGALALAPFMGLFRLWLRLRKPKDVFTLQNPDASFLADIAARAPVSDSAHTLRDVSFFQHRFLDAPYQQDLSYHFYGPKDAPTHYLITRSLLHLGQKVVRVLDYYGELDKKTPLRELIFLGLAEAEKARASQLTMMLTLPKLSSTLLSAGFFLKTLARFCWLCDDPGTMDALAGPIYFTLADSDNDEIG